MLRRGERTLNFKIKVPDGMIRSSEPKSAETAGGITVVSTSTITSLSPLKIVLAREETHLLESVANGHHLICDCEMQDV